MKKVIVVGAGVGGLATALQLLGKGYDVSIYEKNEQIGGKVGFLEKDGFRFDTTASILMLPADFYAIFTSIGKNLDDYVLMKQIPLYYRYFTEGKKYDFHSNLPSLIQTLSSFSSDSPKQYLTFLSDTYQHYEMVEKVFLNETFEGIDFFHPNRLLKGVSLFPFKTANELLSSYIQEEQLRHFLLFQTMYVGISPYHGSSVYTFLPAVTEVYGLWYLQGGMYSYIRALEKVILEYGGKIYRSTPVEEILIEEGKVQGVKVQGETILTDVVVCNADFPYALEYLIKEEDAKGAYTREKIKELSYSCSAFILYLGLNKKYDVLKVHNIVIGEDFAENVEVAFSGKLPTKPPLYLYCPTKIDEAMAPAECECLHVTLRVPNLLNNDIVWDKETIQQMRHTILHTLMQMEGLGDIEEHIVTESYLTPTDMAERYASYGGAAFGLSPTLSQTNVFRPQVKSPTTKGLYFVGSSVHPGTGVAMVLKSSGLAVREIQKNEEI